MSFQISLQHKIFQFIYKLIFYIMCGKKKTVQETKTKTKLLLSVCKRASLMRAPYRGSLQSVPQFIQKNKNASFNKKPKEQPSLIATSNKEKANEKGRCQLFEQIAITNKSDSYSRNLPKNNGQ